VETEWVTVATYFDPVEASLARNQLEAAGILCMLSDEHTVSTFWTLASAFGGHKASSCRDRL
jgi:hypothetical protein